MSKKSPLRMLEKELSEIQQQIHKTQHRTCLAWYSKGKNGRPKLEIKTDSLGNEWPKNIKQPEYELKVDFQWIDILKPKRYLLLDSGRSGGKSWTIASVLLARAIDAPIRVLSTREIQNSLKESAFALFRILIERGSLPFETLEKEVRGNNGSLISFAGLRDHSVESIKSYESYQICWIEEAQTISTRSWEILEPTIRLPGSQIIMSMNRRYRTDAVYQEFIEEKPPGGTVHIIGNYEKNPFLAKDVILRAEEMKKKKPENYAHIYGGGLRVRADSLILKFEIADSPEAFQKQLEEAEKIVTRSASYFGRRLSGVPIQDRKRAIYETIARRHLNGVDFSLGGKSGINAAISLFLDNNRKLIFIKQEIYNNAEIGTFARQMLQVEGWRHERIWCDSAQPALMRIAQQAGVAGIRPVNKGVNLADQLQALQNYTIIINPECQNFIDEISRFEWDVDRSGYTIDRPKAGPDHALDAMRYALSEHLRTEIRRYAEGYNYLSATI